jgi:hypothetical protein
MRTPPALIAVAASTLLLSLSAASAESITPDALIHAGKAATLSEIDYTLRDCGDTRPVETWLREVLGETARSVEWHGGRCVLSMPDRPRDAGTNWCAHAVISPRVVGEDATIEVYFEQPAGGRPGRPFAFRALASTKDGPEYVRETWAFEALWKEAHVPGSSAPGFKGCR